jgi:hypothetical protein
VENIFSKIQDLNSEHVALTEVSDIHMKEVLPKICSSCCDSDSGVHCVMSIQEERPQWSEKDHSQHAFHDTMESLMNLPGK